MIDLVAYGFSVLFGFGFGILFGWVLSLPKDETHYHKELPSDIYMKYKDVGGHITDFTVTNEKVDNLSAYIDMEEWKKCIDECPYYTYESKPKPKKKCKKPSKKQ